MIDAKAKGFNISKVKFEDLVQDAVDRHDAKAFVWLQQQQNIMVKDTNGVERRKNIQNYRKEYLVKWCGYIEKPQKTGNDRILEKAQSAFTAEELAEALKALK